MKCLNQPPRYAQRLLLMFLREDLQEEVMGDLDEMFKAIILSGKPLRAHITYWYQVFNYLRPFAVKKSPPSIFYQGMIANYSKIALRNLGKQKLYSILNIGG